MTLMTETLVHALFAWFQKEKRFMPWREEDDPYKIWVSEIMLQQTQVETVIPYYHRWIKKFPTLNDVALASLQDILKQWEGLGYYTRAKNLHKGAQYVMQELQGKLPQSREALRKIPGIGDYTSAAIASIAFDEPCGVVDGNTSRVISRLFRIGDTLTSLRFKKHVAQEVTDSLKWGSPRWINQAWMELGALICTPNPSCQKCPLHEYCESWQYNCISSYPVKPMKKRIPHRKGAIFIIKNAQKEILLVQRRETGLLPGLWELPNTFYDEQPLSDFIMVNDLTLDRSYVNKAEHTYSHFKVIYELFDATLQSNWWNDYWISFQWVPQNELTAYPRPKVHIKAMKIAGLLS